MATAVWGVLLIWTGTALLLHWGWGIGLLGAGLILLGAQALRAFLRLTVEGFSLVAGTLLVICGVTILAHVAIDIVPLLCIGAGVALLLSTWVARSRGTPGRGPAGQASRPT